MSIISQSKAYYWTSMPIISQSTTYYWTSMPIINQSTAYYWTSMPIISQSTAYYWTSMLIITQTKEYYWTSMPIVWEKKSIYGPPSWVGMISKKTRAEKWWNLATCRAEISHMRPIQGRKLKLFQGRISVVVCTGIRHRLINVFLVININLL